MLGDLLNKLRASLNRHRLRPISEWYFITFDDEKVYVRAEPALKKKWAQEFRWDRIIRICFKAEDYLLSDGIYIFTSDRSASYAIPCEANGGSEFWEEILRRGLFDPELAIEAMSASEGLFIWPPEINLPS